LRRGARATTWPNTAIEQGARMGNGEEQVRELAYRLWEQAGRPDGRGEDFWFQAWRELQGEDMPGEGPPGVLLPPAEEPPEVGALHGVPTGMPGERIAEQGVLDDRLEEMAMPPLADTEDD
jgi:hypothetical protein